MRKTMMAFALGAVLLILAMPWKEANAAIETGVQIGPIIGTPSVDGDLIVYRVSEALGGIDLNDDSDTSDYVIHVVSVGETEPTNLGVAGDIDNIASGIVTMTIRESFQRSDLNGDGDQSDVVLFVYDAATGAVTNLGLPVYQDYYSYTPDVNIAHGNLYFSVSERSAGSDLNADGDSVDNVVHIYNLATGVVTNTGFAGNGMQVDDTAGLMVVYESQQGTDYNGDGDTGDSVPFIYRPSTGEFEILNLAVGGAILADGAAVLIANEADHNATDLNGDGDATDQVTHVFNTASSTLANLNWRYHSVRNVGGVVAMIARESTNGTDMNGDGVLNDDVLFVHDVATGVTHNVGISAGLMQASADTVIFGAFESQNGPSDLNGDGDTRDVVFHWWDVSTATLHNSGLAMDQTNPFSGSGFDMFFGSEPANGRDLNGDGRVSVRRVMHILDHATGEVSSLGLAAGFPAMSEDIVVFPVYESQQGNADLNGDGDTQDPVVHAYDIATGVTTNLGLADSNPWVSGDLVTLSVGEWLQGAEDLNRDGDLGDRVTHIYNPATGVTTNFRTVDSYGYAGHGFLALAVDGTLTLFSVNDDPPLEPTEADLAVSASDRDDPITTVESASYTVTVTNNGPEAATDAWAQISLSSGVESVSFDTSVGTCFMGSTHAICEFGDMQPTASIQVGLTVRYTQPGSTNVNAMVRHTGIDGIGGNDSASESTLVNTPTATDIAIQIQPHSPVEEGEAFTYSITVANDGPEASGGFTVASLLPGNNSSVSATLAGGDCSVGTDSVLSCTRGGLGIGETATVDVTLAVSEAGSYQVMASVAAKSYELDTSNNHAVTSFTVVERQLELADYAAYATSDDGFTVGSHVSISGGPVGSNGLVEILEDSSVENIVSGGEYVYLGYGASVGDVSAVGEVYIEPGVVHGEIEEHADVETLELPPVNAMPAWGVDFWRDWDGGSDEPLALEPRSYGQIESAAGDLVMLSSGHYDFSIVTVNEFSRIIVDLADTDGDGFVDPLIVRVAEHLEFAPEVTMTILNGDGSHVLFLVDGDIAWLGADGVYTGTFITPNGKVKLADSARLNGVALGDHFWAQDNSELIRLPFAHEIPEFSSNDGTAPAGFEPIDYDEPADEPVDEAPIEEEPPVEQEPVTLVTASALTDFGAFAAGIEGLMLSGTSSLSGGIAGSNGTVAVSPFAEVEDILAGENVWLGDHASAGDVTAGMDLWVEDGAVHGDLADSADVASWEIPRLAVDPDWASDIWRTVATSTALELVPGRYGLVESTFEDYIVLGSGRYDLAALALSDNSILSIELTDIDADGEIDPIEVLVAESIEFGIGFEIELFGGDASDVRFYADGEVVFLGASGFYQGTFVAPNGTVIVGEDASLQGAAWGDQVWVQENGGIHTLAYAHLGP